MFGTVSDDRMYLAERVEELGHEVNAIKGELVGKNYNYCAGMARVAEDALRTIMDMLVNENIQGDGL